MLASFCSFWFLNSEIMDNVEPSDILPTVMLEKLLKTFVNIVWKGKACINVDFSPQNIISTSQAGRRRWEVTILLCYQSHKVTNDIFWVTRHSRLRFSTLIDCRYSIS